MSTPPSIVRARRVYLPPPKPGHRGYPELLKRQTAAKERDPRLEKTFSGNSDKSLLTQERVKQDKVTPQNVQEKIVTFIDGCKDLDTDPDHLSGQRVRREVAKQDVLNHTFAGGSPELEIGGPPPSEAWGEKPLGSCDDPPSPRLLAQTEMAYDEFEDEPIEASGGDFSRAVSPTELNHTREDIRPIESPPPLRDTFEEQDFPGLPVRPPSQQDTPYVVPLPHLSHPKIRGDTPPARYPPVNFNQLREISVRPVMPIFPAPIGDMAKWVYTQAEATLL